MTSDGRGQEATVAGMMGKVCIVTGANSGIGRETALALARMGATVVMVVRDRGRGEKARREIAEKSGSDRIDLMLCDLSSMTSVRAFATEFRKKYDRLDVLINNAGAVFDRRGITADGFERTLAVDYLGPFLLTHELIGLMKESAPSRIINVTSGLAEKGTVDLSDLQSERSYSGMRAYSNVKLLLTMYTYELARRLRGTGVTANAVMPGFVATNLGRSSGSLRSSLAFTLMRPFQVSASKGADTPVYLAGSDEVREVTGQCFRKRAMATTCPVSRDESLQKELWERTVEMLGLPRGA